MDSKKKDTEHEDLPMVEENPPEINEEAPRKADAPKSDGEALQTLKNEMLYLRAEFDNSRKRMLKDQSDAIKFANERLIKDLLPLLDLFERGLQHSAKLKDAGPDIKNFVAGIEITHSEFVQLLKGFGVEFIGTAGEKFDPSKHEAISQVECSKDDDGTITQVFEKGAVLQGRLLRPARVVVGKSKE